MGSRARIAAPHTAQNPRRFSASLGERKSSANRAFQATNAPAAAPPCFAQKVWWDRHPERSEGSLFAFVVAPRHAAQKASTPNHALTHVFQASGNSTYRALISCSDLTGGNRGLRGRLRRRLHGIKSSSTPARNGAKRN